MPVTILGKRLLFVTAHPDDESYAASGTMLKNHDAGGKSYVACATLGEQGRSHIKEQITPNRLKMLRKKELLAASRYLKVSALLMAGLPDTGLGNQSNQDIFFKKLLPFAKRHSPELIISFGEDGISGHVDHIGVGRVAKRIAKKLKIPLITFAAPPELHKSIEELKKRRAHGKYVKSLKPPRHDIEIKVNSSKKMKALRFHKSQLDADDPLSNFPTKAKKQFLTREYYSVSDSGGVTRVDSKTMSGIND
jgi:N-acetylglucosamine malate deacetylase 2